MFKLGLIIFAFWGAFQVAHPENKCNVSVNILPAKSVYLEGEPIKLVITYSALGHDDVQILVSPPSFSGALRLKDLSGRLTSGGNLKQLSGISRLQTLSPGSDFAIPLFLQEYFASPPVGSYQIHFDMGVFCNAGGKSSASGTFSFDVIHGTPSQLRSIIAAYDKDLDATDPWTRRYAVEALTSMDNPLVVPELKRLIEIGNSEEAFRSLSRLAGDPDATAVVLDCLKNKNPHLQALAIRVLTEWKLPFNEPLLSELLNSPDRNVRIATIHYVGALGQKKHLHLVQGLSGDPDPYVASEAIRIGHSLERKQQ